jgi:hypothetical protein
MTSEEKVKTVHPKAEARFCSGIGWAVFLNGKVGFNLPDVFSSNQTQSSAWVNARKKLQKEGKL